MARVLVIADLEGTVHVSRGRVLLDESVPPAILDSEHHAVQFLERLAWALADAEAAVTRRPRRLVRGKSPA